MAIRNFWIDLEVDDRATSVEAGPRAKDGGFRLNILMRDSGAKRKVLYVEGVAHEDGTLTLIAQDGKETVFQKRTER